MVLNFGTEANFDLYKIPTLITTNGAAVYVEQPFVGQRRR